MMQIFVLVAVVFNTQGEVVTAKTLRFFDDGAACLAVAYELGTEIVPKDEVVAAATCVRLERPERGSVNE